MNRTVEMAALGRLGFIGAGRLGQTLAVAFAQAGMPIAAVASRRAASSAALAQRVSLCATASGGGASIPPVQVCSSAVEVLVQCDTVFITVNDDQIRPVSDALPWKPGQAAVHASGATELLALSAAEAGGARTAGFHPLHTFGDVETALAGLPGCSVAVEAADPGLNAALQGLARSIGAHPFDLPPGCRALYHASAHYAGSLVVTLMDEALRHWGRFGVSDDAALRALLPLLRSTVRAIESRGLGPGMAGVAARGDVGTLQAHLQALDAVGPDERELYADLTRRSVRLALESGRITPQQAQAMDEALTRPAWRGAAASGPARS